MKKIGTIIALALVLTIGGVYATFNYAENAPTSQSSEFQQNVLAEASVTTLGEISINSNSLTVKVKNGGDNTTVLDDITGEADAAFTANQYANEDAKNNGIVWAIRLDFEGETTTYNGQPVFTTTSWGNDQGKEYDSVLFNGGTAQKSIKLTGLTIKPLLSLTKFILATKAEYDAYKAVLDGITIKITLSQYVVPTVK